MVQLVESDIKTREVLDWKGVHVLHFMGSSCSQKLRVFLNLKGIPWESHHVDLMANENFRPWFLGINPRGLVPVLVHDGAVHIESNDINSGGTDRAQVIFRVMGDLAGLQREAAAGASRARIHPDDVRHLRWP